MGTHPLRGNKWKVGANLNKVERFGPLVPSHTGRVDRERSGASFATYEGQAPQDTWQVCKTGAYSMGQLRDRTGPTFGTANSYGLLSPKPIGPWGHTRMGLKLKAKSVPSLLRERC